MENPVLIIGAQTVGRIALEIFECNSVTAYGFLDDNKKLHQSTVDDLVVMGDTDDEKYLKLLGKKCEAFVATDDVRVHKSMVKKLNEQWHIQPVNAIHPKAAISKRAILGHGNLFDAGVVVEPGAKLGSHCNFFGNAYIGAEVEIGNFVQIGGGCNINAGVRIGEGAFIGSGATLVSGIEIGANARVGAGAVVIRSLKDGETVFGNPAVEIKN